VRVNGRTLVYPEIPESTIVYSPESGKRETFPAAANVITWADDEFLVLENQGSSYGLKLRSGEPSRQNVHKVRVGLWSRDADYSLRVTAGWKLEVWSVAEERDISEGIMKALGGGFARISSRSFWVAGPKHKHDLCVGISWLRKGRTHNLVTQYAGCETVMIDVQTNQVLRRIKGAFVGPVADRSQVVIWQDGVLKFVPL